MKELKRLKEIKANEEKKLRFLLKLKKAKKGDIVIIDDAKDKVL